MGDLISIVIPTYNCSETLPAAIKSVTAQTADNWELIIIDDGSTDDTKEVVQQYLECDKINYHYQQNKGVAAARNEGAKMSCGTYLLFLDSDDKFFPGLIAELNKVGFNQFDLICWQVLKKIDDKYSVWKPQRLEKIYNYITATFLAGSICFNKQLFFDVGAYDPAMTFGENYELGMRICEKENLQIKVLNQKFLLYTVDSSSRKSNSLENRIASYKHLFQKHIFKYEQDMESLSTMQYLLGFVSEKLGRTEEAENFYFSSFKANPLNYKALLRLAWYKIFHK